MSPKFLIYVFMALGSYGGGFLPTLWGDSGFSFTSIFAGMVGGLIGIWAGYKLSQYF